MDPVERPRIVLANLPPRDEPTGEQEIPRVVADEGGSCYQNCDCRFGLICREGSCVSDW
jgi:hypothetical protein